MWRETTKQERNQKIFIEEFEDFLPSKILDFHLHVFPKNTIVDGTHFSCAGHPILKYDLDDLSQDLHEMYPGRETSAVCFGFPEVTYDMEHNNQYLAEQCDHKRFFPLRLFDPLNDTPEKLHEDLQSKKYLGLKPYLDYVRKPNLNDVEIIEMLPDWAMEIVNEYGLLVMLHIPRKGRLADPLNQKQLINLCSRYPNAKIILAHIGRAYYLQCIEGHLEPIKHLPNLYYDLAMLNHWEVLEYFFREAPHDKMLYGTDIPLALAPGKSVEINNQYTYVTPVPWKLSISDEHKKLTFTSFLYEELRSIKKAVERLNLDKSFTEKLFYTNGAMLLNTVLTEPLKLR
jgi:hypothetical protein